MAAVAAPATAVIVSPEPPVAATPVTIQLQGDTSVDIPVEVQLSKDGRPVVVQLQLTLQIKLKP